MIKILVADGHSIVRAGFKQMLSKNQDIAIAGEAINGADAINQIRSHDWDVVLLNMVMPGKDGFEVLNQIKKEQPKLPVITFSIYKEGQYAVRAMKAGAAGYLNDNFSADQLVAAVRTVAVGKKYVTDYLAEKLAVALDTVAEKNPHERLSDREYQIFEKLAVGEQVSGIAGELNLSSKTVSSHRTNILKKMDLANNSELIYYAVSNGLVSHWVVGGKKKQFEPA